MVAGGWGSERLHRREETWVSHPRICELWEWEQKGRGDHSKWSVSKLGIRWGGDGIRGEEGE